MQEIRRAGSVLARTWGAALLPLLVAAAEPEWRALDRDAREAARAGDYRRLEKDLRALAPLLPGNPRIRYNLAACAARRGDRAAALAGLRALADAGLRYDVAADEDFATLRGDEEFRSLGARLLGRAQVSRARRAFAVPGTDLLPEDLAYDARTRRFFLSSVRTGRILTSDGRVFARSALPVLALRADSERRLLYATTGYVPQGERSDKAQRDRTALLVFDLDSGARRREVPSPLPGLLGDMTLGRGGDVYVSEGLHGAVLRLRHGAAALERLDPPGELASPQTPALSEDERTLFVPDYLRGLAALDLGTGHLRWLPAAPAVVTAGIDGLYRVPGGFLALQNGVTPPRILRLSADLSQQQVLEAGWPGLGEPTHGVLVGELFYFLTSTGWDAYDEQGRRKPGVAPVRSAVYALPLAP